MTTVPYDVEVRAFDRATGLRLPLNPKLVLSGVTWSYVELGGAEMATIPIKVPFEQVPVANGDFVEIWTLNTGETVPRWRGIVNVGERDLRLKEAHIITAYGRMEDMAHVVVDKVICFPNSITSGNVNPGADLAQFAGNILSDYQGRILQSAATYIPLIAQDVQQTGINIITLNAALTTARAAMDSIAKQGGDNVVWGWDIDPSTGADRFYLRPRVDSIGAQFYIGVGISQVTAPMEYQALTNALWVKGGPATYPNLLTNPSFETPQVPTGQSGNLLGDGGFEASGASGVFIDWTGINGATLATHEPSNNWNFSAHTGAWCVTLGYTNAEVYQEIAAAAGTAYVASLFAAREDGAFADTGALIVEGRNASDAVVETYTLAFKPPSVAWTGGQASTVLGGTAIQLPVTFQSTSITKARIRVKATNAGSATQNLLVDDILFAPVGGVGSLGWGTHIEHIGSALNSVNSIDWASAMNAWDGSYCVRISTTASSSDKVYLAPLPEPGSSGGEEFATGGYQFKPTPGMNLRIGCRVRMSPGVAAGAGSVGLEYRSHAGDGHENQFIEGALVSIPNDGNWYWVYIDIDVNGDTTIAVCQLSFNTSDWYDVDGWSARDVAAAEGGTNATGMIALDPGASQYLRGKDFEATIDVASAEVISAGLSSAAQSSISTYGRREAVISNSNLVAINGQFYSFVASYLNQFAVPLGRTRVSLIDEWDQQPNPNSGKLIRISGTSNDIPDQYATRTSYTWSGLLSVDVELTTQRPSLDKMLLSAALASRGAGTSSTGAAIAASSSGTPSSGGTAQAALTQTDSFAVSGASYTLSQTPDGNAFTLFGDGIEQPAANYSYSGTALTIAAGVTLANWMTIAVKYSYQPVAS